VCELCKENHVNNTTVSSWKDGDAVEIAIQKGRAWYDFSVGPRSGEIQPINLVPVPTPLCKHHYHEVYKLLQPQQRKSVTCDTSLRHDIAQTQK
jgi:hypothetical protein